MDCISASDCKGVYVGNTTGGSESSYFFDCDSVACTSGSVADLDNPPTRTALSCPTSADCKLVYYDLFVSATDSPVNFADCTNEDCLPDWESLTAPWTSETSVASVSLTYDSNNTELIANIVKDATNQQAYYNVYNLGTTSWGGSTAYDGFTAGAMDNMSSPETAAGTAQMGVLVRLGVNMEFDLFATTTTGPTLDQVMRHGNWFSSGSEQAFTF